MDVCYPALTTAALFFTFIIIDIIRRNYRAITGRFLFGAVAILLMLYLCQSGAELVAWGLLAIPVIFLILGFTLGALKPETAPVVPGPLPTPMEPESPCYNCGKGACICPGVLPFSSPSGAVHDTSGNVVIPAPPSATPSQTAPTTTTCGPDSASGKTQCVNTRALTSA